LRLADYVVNETGFGSDLGAEKYFDIVMPSSGIRPAVAVIVSTLQSVQNQGQGDFQAGLANFRQHIRILRGFGVPIVAAINRFPCDSPADLARLAAFCKANGIVSALSEAFAHGGEGARELAETVVDTIARNADSSPRSIYSPENTLQEKIQKIAQSVYGASGVTFTDQAKSKLQQFSDWGFAKLPVCIAKTQYSLSDNPKLLGAPTGWSLQVGDASLSAGAGFVVALAGNMMLMPGLPKVPRVASIDVDSSGQILGV
jgi:formate--tetrahydrofolate ligase